MKPPTPSIADWAIVAFAGLTFILLIIELRMSTRQANTLRELTENDQRSWIGPKQYKILSKSFDDPAGFRIIVTWENTGKTPAQNVKAIASLRTKPCGEKVIYEYDWSGDISICTIFPNATMHSDIVENIDAWMAAQIMSGERILYLFGVALYEDVFGKTHETRIAHSFDPSTANWNNLDYHNEAT